MNKNFKQEPRNIEQILNDCNDGSIIFNQVKYQRKYVWKDLSMKRDLILSILFDMPIGTIILWDKNKPNTVEVIDGQQRIQTICDFRKDIFSLDHQYIKKLFLIK